jgi:hypothetical protein
MADPLTQQQKIVWEKGTEPYFLEKGTEPYFLL